RVGVGDSLGDRAREGPARVVRAADRKVRLAQPVERLARGRVGGDGLLEARERDVEAALLERDLSRLRQLPPAGGRRGGRQTGDDRRAQKCGQYGRAAAAPFAPGGPDSHATYHRRWLLLWFHSHLTGGGLRTPPGSPGRSPGAPRRAARCHS